MDFLFVTIKANPSHPAIVNSQLNVKPSLSFPFEIQEESSMTHIYHLLLLLFFPNIAFRP